MDESKKRWWRTRRETGDRYEKEARSRMRAKRLWKMRGEIILTYGKDVRYRRKRGER